MQSTAPKFKHGQRVRVSDHSIGLFGEKTKMTFTTRQIVDVRRRGEGFEYQMLGATYYVPELRVHPLEEPNSEK